MKPQALHPGAHFLALRVGVVRYLISQLDFISQSCWWYKFECGQLWASALSAYLMPIQAYGLHACVKEDVREKNFTHATISPLPLPTFNLQHRLGYSDVMNSPIKGSQSA